jgi:pyruvate dehydrogenase E1 component
VTSFTELAREAREVERWNRLHPEQQQRTSHVATCLSGSVPVVAATDYVRAVPQLVASYIEPRYTVLGTDGFGRSDTRSALREFFEIDRHHIAVAALASLAGQGLIDKQLSAQAIARYGLVVEATPPWQA